MPEKEIIIEIAIERLRDYPGSPFKVTQDELMSELIESVRTYGILIPLIVRPMPDGCYQIISGHRRKYAAAQLGYRKLPVIIRALNDDQALVAMVDSNLQREKIRISEKAFAYRMKYDVVKREGKDPKEYFYGEKYHGIKTIEFMGKEQRDSPKQVQRISDDPNELRLKVRYEIIPLIREYIKDGILNCLPEDAGKFFDAWEKLLPYESSVNLDSEGEGDELDP